MAFLGKISIRYMGRKAVERLNFIMDKAEKFNKEGDVTRCARALEMFAMEMSEYMAKTFKKLRETDAAIDKMYQKIYKNMAQSAENLEQSSTDMDGLHDSSDGDYKW